MDQPKITYRNPADLAVHPLLKHVPLLHATVDDPRFCALVQDIRENGVTDPVKVTKEGELADGRRRVAACKRLQMDVPTMIVAEDQVPSLIIGSVVHRTHCTPGQRAYLLVPVMEDAFDAAQKRRLTNLNQGGKVPERNSVSFGKTVDDWAEQIGVSVQYLRSARKVRELFAAHAKTEWTWSDADTLALLGQDADAKLTLRDYYEPQILAEEDPVGLGAVVAGIKSRLDQAKAEAAGKKHGGGKPKETEKAVRLFVRTFVDLRNRLPYWEKFQEEDKRAAGQAFLGAIEAMPDDLFGRLAASVRKEAARRKTAPMQNAECRMQKGAFPNYEC